MEKQNPLPPTGFESRTVQPAMTATPTARARPFHELGRQNKKKSFRKVKYKSFHVLTNLFIDALLTVRRIFGPRRDEVTGEWRRLHNKELNDMYSSPNIVRVIKSRRMRWAGHVASMGEERGRIGSWWGNRRERDHWEDLGVDGWIILGWISRRWDVGMWTRLGWPRTGTGDGRL